MIEKEKTLCFTGRRTEKLPKTAEAQEALKLAIFKEIDTAIAQGFDTFLMGACYGFDLMAAVQVNYRRHIINPDDPGKIILIAVVPFEGQANRWSEPDRELYFTMLPLCDEVVTLNAHYKNGCYHERNRWLVDHSITICGSQWYNHANQQGCHAIDFVNEHDNTSFPEAVPASLFGHFLLIPNNRNLFRLFTDSPALQCKNHVRGTLKKSHVFFQLTPHLQ